MIAEGVKKGGYFLAVVVGILAAIVGSSHLLFALSVGFVPTGDRVVQRNHMADAGFLLLLGMLWLISAWGVRQGKRWGNLLLIAIFLFEFLLFRSAMR